MPQVDTSRFSNPLPVLATDIDSIEIETKDIYNGSFTIKNTGGGILEGKIISHCKWLIFNPTKFEGNNQTINYTFDSTCLTAGQSAKGFVYISSSGGEKCIPASAKLAKMSVTTAEGFAITNLHDFFQYANIHPAQARRLFVDSEFYMLLLAIGYEYMDIYESLHRDPNRERAMDNFFILSGLKGKTGVSILCAGQGVPSHDAKCDCIQIATGLFRKKPPVRKIEFIQNPGDRQTLHGHITIEKSDYGYVETQIALQENAAWLSFHQNKLYHARAGNSPAHATGGCCEVATSDLKQKKLPLRSITNEFKDNLTAMLQFSIDPTKITSSCAQELVTIGTETVVITYRRTAPAILRLNQAAYRYEDSGVIKVVNNTGKDMRVEVFCPESYVRFSARSYLVGEYGEIPFDIKLSAFLSAQLFFRKLPYMKTTVEIKATTPGKLFKKKLPIIVGEW